MAKGRVKSLDGLRGIAALAVLFSHVVLGSSAASADYYTTPLARSPLHILWGGKEMVFIFFVLSGYVLALPAVKNGFGWFDRSYYPRRFLRLYLPVWAALLLAAVIHALFARNYAPGANIWLNQHAVPLTLHGGIVSGGLMSQGPEMWQYTSVLWSLEYEVIFSALLPVLLVLPILTRERPRLALLCGVLCLALIWRGASDGNQMLHYMPFFPLGSLLAFHAQRVRLPRGLTLLLCLAFLTIGNWSWATGSSEVACACGAVLAVWLAVDSRLLSTRPAKWLGSRSYSLYLVHEPIVVVFAFAFGGRESPFLLLVLALPLSLVTADLFWRYVERPAIRFARRVGELVLPDQSATLRTSIGLK